MCRSAAFVYTCKHRFLLGTSPCIHRQRIDNNVDLLQPSYVLMLVRECDKDAKKGLELKPKQFKCGRCEYEGLSQSDESS